MGGLFVRVVCLRRSTPPPVHPGSCQAFRPQAALTNQPLVVRGHPRVEFTHVDDAAQAVLLAVRKLGMWASQSVPRGNAAPGCILLNSIQFGVGGAVGPYAPRPPLPRPDHSRGDPIMGQASPAWAVSSWGGWSLSAWRAVIWVTSSSLVCPIRWGVRGAQAPRCLLPTGHCAVVLWERGARSGGWMAG